MRRARTLVLLALALFLVAPAVRAEVLDPTYGEGGRTRASFDDLDPIGSTFGTIDAAGRAVQIAVGSPTDRVIRFTSDGQPDRSFGVGGEAPLPDGIAFWVEAVPGHGVVVGGFAREGYEYVLRLTEDGRRDTRFGVDGMLFDSEGEQDLNPIAFGPDGQLLVLRRQPGPQLVLRLELYKADGDLDLGFGEAGSMDAFGLAGDDTARTASDFDAAGRLVYVTTPCSTCAEIRRLTAAGAPDPTFGQSGAFVLTPVESMPYWALDLDEDHVVVAGQSSTGTTRVWRSTATGQSDPTFAGPATHTLVGPGQIRVDLLAQGRSVITTDGSGGQSVLVLAANGAKDPGWTTNPRTYDDDAVLGAGDGGVGGRLLLGRTTERGLSFVSRYLLDPGGLPAPEITTVVERPDGVSIGWEAPGALAAEAVGYHVIVMYGTRIGGHTFVAGDAREASITGLQPDDIFEAVVVPYTRAGAGPRSEPRDVWTDDGGPEAGAPSSVGQISVHGVDRGLQVSWAPANSNGAPVLAYSVIAVDPATGQIAGWRNVGADVRSAALGGLSADRTNYLVHVVAWNEHGIGGPNFSGGWTDPGQAGMPPSVPWVSAVRAPGATYVTWGAPVEHGQPVVGFDVVVVEDGKMLSWAQPGPEQRQLVLPALKSGSDAQVYVFAHSAGGFGPVGAPAEP